MSCCHVARPCSNGSISARRRIRRRCPSSCCVSHSCPEFDFLVSSTGNSNNKGLLHSSSCSGDGSWTLGFLDAGLVRARASAYTCTSSGSYAPPLNDFIYVPVDCKHVLPATVLPSSMTEQSIFKHVPFSVPGRVARMSQMSLYFQLRWLTRRPVSKSHQLQYTPPFSVGHL